MNAQLIEICAEVLGVSPSALGPTSNASTVDGWDSIKHWEIIGAVEATFDVELSMDEALALRDLADLEAALVRHGALPGVPA